MTALMFQNLDQSIEWKKETRIALREEKLRTEEAVAKQNKNFCMRKKNCIIFFMLKKEPQTGTDQQNSLRISTCQTRAIIFTTVKRMKELFGRRPEDTRRTYEHGGLPTTIF